MNTLARCAGGLAVFACLSCTAVLLASLSPSLAHAQQLTPFQQQVLRGIKKTLTEYLQKQHAICDATTKRVCDIGRVDVIDEVVASWENTPVYGKYVVEMLQWHVNLSPAIADMASDYVVRYGHLDAGFDRELRRRMTTDPVFELPKEYLCRHMFGSPHLYGATKGDLCAPEPR